MILPTLTHTFGVELGVIDTSSMEVAEFEPGVESRVDATVVVAKASEHATKVIFADTIFVSGLMNILDDCC